MATRTGSADLPLHGGRVPAWLASRMAELGRLMVEALVLEYGRGEVLRRLANPFWFQSLGCVMGMDWHSSGITTSVLGALKRGLAPVANELGLYVCGGRGRHSRQTPAELQAIGERTGLDGTALARTSRLVAKVDSAAVQDGFDLYLHGFIVAADGGWTVVQQGMNGDRGQARRYHWLWERAGTLVDEPHAAIEGASQGTILNLTDRRASDARQVDLELGRGDPLVVTEALARLQAAPPPAPTLSPPPPHLTMPPHHDVRLHNLDLRRLAGALRVVAERGPADFPELLLVPGFGARTLFALSLVAEVLHGAPSRFQDPARFSLAHGGKDGHPFPVPLGVYDQTLRVMRDAVSRARLGNEDRLGALRRLDDQCRLAEAAAEGRPLPSLPALFAEERALAPARGGRTVFDDRPARPTRPRGKRQLSLF
jgi:hypothetical protein